MKTRFVFYFWLMMFSLQVSARGVRLWSQAQLENESDLMVVATPIETKDLVETSSLGWDTGQTGVSFRGVETTFQVFEVLKGICDTNRIVLHHYREDRIVASTVLIPAVTNGPFFMIPSPLDNGPGFIGFVLNKTNRLLLYLVKDGSNRYAPVTGQIDPARSFKPLSGDGKDLADVLRKIPGRVPELEAAWITNGSALPDVTWIGEEVARATFVLPKHLRYMTNDFPRGPRVIPMIDLWVTMVRYSSSNEAQQAVEESLMLRQAAHRPKENYHGSALYTFTSGGGTVICQAGEYVVEITGEGEPLVMKTLDAVLAELPKNEAAAGRSAFPAVAPTLEQIPAARQYFESYLNQCGPNDVRCLWFLDNNPRVGMVMTIDLNGQAVFTVRDVFDWAQQSAETRTLSHSQVLTLKQIINDLPPSDTNSEFSGSVFVAKRNSAKTEVFRFDRRHPPPVVRRIYDIGGGYLP